MHNGSLQEMDVPSGGYLATGYGHGIPVVFVSGSPYERGQQRGRQIPNLIASRVARVCAAYRAVDGGGSATVTADRVEAAMEGTAPEMLAELRGIADGSGLPWEDLRLAAFGRSVQNAEQVRSRLDEDCSCMVASGPATAQGRLLMAKNADLMPPLLDATDYLIMVVSPESGYKHVLIGVFPERPTQPEGINEHGLTLVGSGQAPLDGRTAWTNGSPIGLAVHDAQARIYANCRTVGEALEVLREEPRGYYGRVLLIGDANGDWAKVEISHTNIAVSAPTPDLGFAMNHAAAGVSGVFCAPHMRGLLKNRAIAPSPYVRYDRYMTLLQRYAGEITRDVMIEILRDHGKGAGPDSICKHADGATLGAAIFEPETRSAWIAQGAPCGANFIPLPDYWSKVGEGVSA